MGNLYKRCKCDESAKCDHAWWGAFFNPLIKKHDRVSMYTNNEKVANTRLLAHELGQPDAAADRPAPKKESPTLNDAALAWLPSVKNPKTYKFYEQKIRHVIRVMGASKRLASITTEDCEAYIEEREGEPAHSHTIYKELVALRQCLKFHKISTAFVPEYAANYEPRKTWVSHTQFDTLIRELESDRWAWVMIACYAGLRDSEIERMQPDWIDWELKVINVNGTKTDGSARVVPIHPELEPYLERLPVKPWNNVDRDLNGYHDKKQDKHYIGAVQKANNKLGPKYRMKRVTPNDFRRTFASWMLQAGVSNFAVAKLLGHSSTRMVDKVYGQLGLKAAREAVNAIGGNMTSVDDVLDYEKLARAMLKVGAENANVLKPIQPRRRALAA